MGSQKNKLSKSKILNDHKKIGKTLIPPMRQYLGEQGLVSWVDRILPELIWLAVIIENLGVNRGVEIAAKIAKLANQILPDEYFAFVSSFDLLSNEQKEKLV
jgi:hypothetical protein